jgi:phosphohistidine phosphatase
MKTLLILRHAKSSWKHPELSDHDRPLNKRGKHDAPLMGQLLNEKKLVPDLIISSTAVRAKDTALAVAERVGYDNEIIFESTLYAASPDAYIKAISNVADNGKDFYTILVVGHNPGLEELIEVLTGEMHELATCELAVIELPTKKWSNLNIRQGKLIDEIRIKH